MSRDGARRVEGSRPRAYRNLEKEGPPASTPASQVSVLSTQFVVFLENRPGALAELAELLSVAEVNIEAILLEGSVDFGNVRLHVDSPRKAEKALKDGGYQYRKGDAITLQLPNEPGALAEVAKRLAKAKVNIDSLFGTSAPGAEKAEFVLLVSDEPKARKALGLE